MDALLKNNGGHSGCCIGVGYELSMIFSNTEDQAWSQYKQLHEMEYLIETEINLTIQGIRGL
jgi:hypothetical protein